MFIEPTSKVAEFRIRFARWSPPDEPVARCPYVGKFRIEGAKAIAVGIPARVFRTAAALGAAFGAVTMIVASLIIGSRPGNVWKSLLPGVLVVLFFCAAGWLIAHVRRIKLPLMLADANIDISDDLDVPYARIFRSDGQYLFFVPDPGRQEEFRRLRDGLIELFNSPPAADSPAGPATSKENA